MNATPVPVIKKETFFSSGDFPFADILSPYIHKGAFAHSSYYIGSGNSNSSSFRVELKGTENLCKQGLNHAREELLMSPDDFPYGLTESQWWEYALSPHSYLALGKCIYQVGLNYFNRFLHLDTKTSESYLIDPNVDEEFLSTTNWFDSESGELWFASWSARETLRRNIDQRDKVKVTIWNLSLNKNKLKKIWQGNLGDSLHQLTISPDKKFLVLAELGLRPEKSPANKKVVPSKVLILDLKTMQEWRLELPAAAHVEFDPNDSSVCYLSGHNIGLIGPKVGIFGPGVIQKVRLTQSGPQFMGSFSHPSFFRITTHIVFNQQLKTYIAASGYPGHIFLIDASNMQLEKIIGMNTEDTVDASDSPHICTQDSYGIAASKDGRYLFVCVTGATRIIDLQTSKLVMEEKITDDNSFTGHIAQINNAA